MACAVFVEPVKYGTLTACISAALVVYLLRWNCSTAESLNVTSPTRLIVGPLAELSMSSV